MVRLLVEFSESPGPVRSAVLSTMTRVLKLVKDPKVKEVVSTFLVVFPFWSRPFSLVKV